MTSSDPPLDKLATLLARRLEIIADHAWRDADPDAHLNALREVSESIEAEHQSLRPQLPPRLRHYLQQASYQKALALLQGAGD